MRVVFMGTPDFAVATLSAIDHHFEIAAVVTTPDKPAGRGLQLHSSEVKKWATAHNLPILQPVKLKDPDFLEQLQALQADVFVVVAFRMLPKEVYAMPPKGCFNVHASLLPQYRGAAPIHRAVMNGETATGVTTFFLNHEIDTGDIILQKSTPIEKEETTGELYARLMQLGAEAAVETLQAIEKGDVPTTPQPTIGADLHLAPKIFKEDTKIEWKNSAQTLCNFVRGLNPYPTAFTQLKNKEGQLFSLKIYEIEIMDEPSLKTPGTFEVSTKKELMVHTIDHKIKITTLQFQGKSRMKTVDFLNGFRVDLFENIFC